MTPCAREDATTTHGEELRDKILFALFTGLRPEELLRIQVSWIAEAARGAQVAGFLHLAR